MSDSRRRQLIEFVEREFIGPDPIAWDGLKQENGEEILVSDPPRIRYIAGILFPYESTNEEIEASEEEVGESVEEDEREDPGDDHPSKKSPIVDVEYLEDAEELINRSNAYKQSAISLTAAVREGDNVFIEVSAGVYNAITSTDRKTGKTITRYPRKAIKWTNKEQPLVMPTTEDGIKKINVDDTGLKFDITYRYKEKDYSIYTFTLENAKVKRTEGIRDDECFFQVKFKLKSKVGFHSLPDSPRINRDDEDYWSNQLLYRNIRNYAIGHGCAADWQESDGKVTWISSTIFPSYEIKPIIPNQIPGVELDMFQMSDLGDFATTVFELNTVCEKYKSWINKLKKEVIGLEDKYKQTANKHITNCEVCLDRMTKGIDLLQNNKIVRQAFQFMNRAMLLQQLRYNLPLQKWGDDGNGNIKLENPVDQLPVVTDKSTWYDLENKKYGRWRPFQLAFILMNLNSIYDKKCNERNIVDLIWFPTGGGKTEAYLGLSAYTIFIRRLKDKNDSGTAILMRYTLRLLTAQQYERASSMICACDTIRKEYEDLLGTARISIGLWVGSSTTPNSMKDAVKAYDKLYNGRSDINPFVILKCPWCGAQMGLVYKGADLRDLPGYKKITEGPQRQRRIVFQCRNMEKNCDFSFPGNELPLYIVDEEIYKKTPTLLLGTVDKFAMLPFRPSAQGLFGYHNGEKHTSPDLIIQDEVHLISGPLGSMVGHYETLIHELCVHRTISDEICPKVIASTATISHAREQCHALYGCGKDKVFQFPPAGLDAGDSFFAKEDKKQNGRKYVGILATGSSSDTTTAIRLFSSLLYGTKEMKVGSEEMRDPYWTNIGYFNSIRELGQAATWIRADIDQHLDVMYKRRYYHKRYQKEEYQHRRRYIQRYEELTSRIRSDKVTESLENLNIKYPSEIDRNGKVKDHPIDICLATNMISVGLDISRLGLMTVSGQPKTTSEYIQATSRVGRDADIGPGVVFVLYRPGRPRDKSHYEQFRSYHSRIYCNVEPTSVTPFSAPVRERALHAIIIGMMRLKGNASFNSDPPHLPGKVICDQICTIIKNRIKKIDPKELNATMTKIEYITRCWEDWKPQKWEPDRNRDWSYGSIVPLMFPAGSLRNKNWGNRGLETPISMRSVDASCEAEVLQNRYFEEET
ncbi:MAG: helicase-related protein [Kosmotogaceae bacterium]